MSALLAARDIAPIFGRSPVTIGRWMREGRLATVALSPHHHRHVALATIDALTGDAHLYDGPERLSQRHAAAWLGVSPATVHRAVASGFIPVDEHGAVPGDWIRSLIETPDRDAEGAAEPSGAPRT